MKFFTSFRWTGEDPEKMKQLMKVVCSTLEKVGHEHHCNFWKDDYKYVQKTHKEIIDEALRDIDNDDCFLAIVRSDEKSEGMLIEVGYARAKGKRMILVIKKGVKTNYLKHLFDEIIEWKNLKDLSDKISKIK